MATGEFMTETSIAIIPRTMPEIQSMAEVFAKSNLLPEALRGKIPDVIVQIMAGAELGLPPLASIRGVHIVAGKPILSSDTMVALVRKSGSCEYFMVENETETSVTYVCKRVGDPKEQRYTWSDEDTKLAGLNTKDNWRLFKKQMRRARCKAILARDVWPDVLAAVYEFDSAEIEILRSSVAQRESPPSVAPAEIIDAEIVSETTEDLAALCTAAATVDDLKALMPKCAALAGAPRVAAREAYSARMKALSETAA